MQRATEVMLKKQAISLKVSGSRAFKLDHPSTGSTSLQVNVELN